MDSPLALEKLAALAAEIESGVSEGDVLAREGMSMEQWTALQDEWRTRISDGLAQGNFELTNRYNAAFLARRASLRYGPKPLAPTGAASSSGGRANHAHTLQSTSDTASDSLKTEPILPEANASEAFGEGYASRSSEVPGEPSNFASRVEDEPTPAPTTPTLPAGNRPSSPHGLQQASAPQAAAPGKKFEAREDTEPAFHLLKSAQPPPHENAEDEPHETPLVAGLPFRRASESDEATTPRMQMATLPDALPFRPSPLSAQMNAARAEAAPAPPSQGPGRYPFAPPPPAPSRPGAMPSPAGSVPTGSPSFSAPAQHPPQHSGYLPSMPNPASGMAAGGAPQYPHVPQAAQHQQNPHAYSAPMAAPSFGSGLPQPPAAPPPGAPITFGPAASPQKTGPVAVFNPQAPQAPSAGSMSPMPSMPGGYPPFVPPAPSFGSNNASPSGAPSFGPAPPPPTSTAPSGALPMPASLGASTSRLSLEQYAMLSAEIAISPGTSAAVRARYGLDETMHIAETGLWQRRFSADKDLFTRYSSLFQNYREWFSKAAR